MSSEIKEVQYLQIRRPNKLFEKPLKKSLALLFDVLGFNFYVKNPEDSEFRMSWVDLERVYGINTRNKENIKNKLEALKNMNYISDLKTWNNGFSYRFVNTFISLEEMFKPKNWTFLNFDLMMKLDSISYKLYVFAYKFFDFTDKSKKALSFKNQTKYLDVEQLLEMFNSNIVNNVQYSKNRLFGLIRKAVLNLENNHGIKINLLFRKFGRPITHIKFHFEAVPKLQKIISKFMDLTAEKLIRVL